jgi:hypothetical protein
MSYIFPEIALFKRELQRMVAARQATHVVVVIKEIEFCSKYRLWPKTQLGHYEVSVV